MGKAKIYFPNLDGLRFFCFLSVFFYHSFYTTNKTLLGNPIYKFFAHGLFRNGNLGVNFFFVLSGFLITYLLIRENETKERIHIGYFWLRRILRIWPLYFFCVGFGFVIFPILKQFFGEVSHESANILNYLTFTSNFDLIKNGLPDSSVLGVLWSIAIEEQFYFFWPVFLLLVNRKYYNHLFILIILGTFVFRYFHDSYLMHECHTLSCIGDMATGALGASLSMNHKFLNRIKVLTKFSIIGIYIVFIVIYFFRSEIFFQYQITRIFERFIIAIIISLIILEQNFAENSLFKLSNRKYITKLGGLTYGLYCLHFIGILITIKTTLVLDINKYLWEVIIVETLMALFLSFLLALCSFNYYESFFLKIKGRFSFITKS